MKYRYSVRFTPDGYERRPVIPVILQHKGMSMPVSGLIDSGSDDTLIDSALAPVLGIDVNELGTVRVGGIGSGITDGRTGLLTLIFPDFEYRYSTNVVLTSLPVPLLLGYDFFQHFNVLFEASKGTFTITRAKLRT